VRFSDRRDAGRRLAQELRKYADADAVVLGLARGGVAIGFEIAVGLRAPLEVILVRKIGVPWQRELAAGAIVDGSTPEQFIDESLISLLSISRSYLEAEIERERKEIERRRRLYTRGRPPIEIRDRPAIVVDDGIATGSSMRVALRAIRRREPARLVLAVPVAASDSLSVLRAEADETVCLHATNDLEAISVFYYDFHDVDDAEVTALLDQAQQALVRSEGPDPTR
jgi:putative phosphoribosyl transferase